MVNAQRQRKSARGFKRQARDESGARELLKRDYKLKIYLQRVHVIYSRGTEVTDIQKTIKQKEMTDEIRHNWSAKSGGADEIRRAN